MECAYVSTDLFVLEYKFHLKRFFAFAQPSVVIGLSSDEHRKYTFWICIQYNRRLRSTARGLYAIGQAVIKCKVQYCRIRLAVKSQNMRELKRRL
eukprot:6204200-Pleurochrysis_carterae.AAC.2